MIHKFKNKGQLKEDNIELVAGEVITCSDSGRMKINYKNNNTYYNDLQFIGERDFNNVSVHTANTTYIYAEADTHIFNTGAARVIIKFGELAKPPNTVLNQAYRKELDKAIGVPIYLHNNTTNADIEIKTYSNVYSNEKTITFGLNGNSNSTYIKKGYAVKLILIPYNGRYKFLVENLEYSNY